MFQCLSYLQNFILLKSVEYIKSYRQLSAHAENSEFRFSGLRRQLKCVQRKLDNAGTAIETHFLLF